MRSAVASRTTPPRRTRPRRPEGRWASERREARSFDHLICPQQQGGRDRETQGLRCPQIDDEIKLGRLLNRQVAGLGALENSVHVARTSTEDIGHVGPIAKKCSGFSVVRDLKDAW